MKIIDNKKDFYDYLVGEYGIDDLIVFDRRKSIVIKTDIKPEKHNDYLFSTIKGDEDIYPKENISYSSGIRKIEKMGTYHWWCVNFNYSISICCYFANYIVFLILRFELT